MTEQDTDRKYVEEAAVTGTQNPDPLQEQDTEAPAGGGADVDTTAMREELAQARAEAEEHRDKYLRAVAELENSRRRAENDLANVRKFAIEGFAAEMLNVRDSLELARTVEISAEDTAAVEKMKEGVELTLRQMDSIFVKFQIEEVNPQAGDKLDPERHQAMTIQESSEVPPNHILAVVQKGYLIHDRLLRPAMVIVAKAAQVAEPDTTASKA
jgi:molecular chaperone GrpE